MSDIREVTVRYGRTVSTAPYESERVDVELTATVGPDEAAGLVVERLGALCRGHAEAQLRKAEAQRRDDAPIHLTDEQVRRLGGKP